MKLTTLLLLAAAPLTASTAGQEAPRHWTPAAIASDQYEASPTFTPDGREMFLLRGDPGFAMWRILHSTCTAKGWSAPVEASFSAATGIAEADPGITPDGKRLYYVSARHRFAEAGNDDLDIWYVDRTPGGGWGPPQRMPEPVNSNASELLPRATADGRIFFGSSRDGGLGGSDLYVATPQDGGGWRVENLGPAINSAGQEYEADVSADGRALILVADRGDRSHLYRFALEDRTWVEKGRVPARHDVFQVGPLLSPDGKRLLFAQADGARSGEIFQIDLAAKPDPQWPPRCGS
jgi:Tol biopolymer transport system component